MPAALVAVDVPSGEVLAAANSPTSGFDRALTGRYPPGSTFKVATTLRLPHPRHHDPGGDGAVPGTVTVDGRRVPQLRRRVDQRHPDLLPGLHRLVQHGLRRARPASSATTTSRPRPPRPSASAPAGATRSASPAPSTAACRPPRAAPTPRRPRSVRAASRSHPLSLAVMVGQHRAGHLRAAGARQGPPTRGTPRRRRSTAAAVAQLRSMMSSVVSSGTGTALRGTPRAGRCAARPARPSTAATRTCRRGCGSPATRATSRSRCSSRRAGAAAPSRRRSPRTSSPTWPRD